MTDTPQPRRSLADICHAGVEITVTARGRGFTASAYYRNGTNDEGAPTGVAYGASPTLAINAALVELMRAVNQSNTPTK